MNQDALNILLNMKTVSLDLETTGVKPSDQVWSGGFYSAKGRTVLNKHESFFDINLKDDLPKDATLEDMLEAAHSSKEFGARQAGKGFYDNGKRTTNVLSGWANAVSAGQLSSKSDFVASLAEELKGTAGGSVLLMQNVNFEDRVLSKLFAEGNLETFPSITGNLVDRGMPASNTAKFGDPFERFLMPAAVSDLRKQQSASLRGVFSDLKSGVKNSGHLHSYYKDSMNIVDHYIRSAEKASQTGGTAVVDLMDLTRALYAHGAMSGQIQPEMLSFGSKVETLTRALLWGAEETHAALSDATQQKQLYDKIVEELITIRQKGVDYKSPMVEKLANQMVVDKTFSKQLKSRALSVTREYLENSKTVTIEGLEKEIDTRFVANNVHLNKTVKEDFNTTDYVSKLKAKAASYFKEDGSLEKPVEDIMSELEGFSSSYSIGVKDELKLKASSLDFKKILNHKGTKIAAGVTSVGLVGSMLFGGNKEKQEEVKYNTYDELYNNQYYGSAFADWQNRNNSHKMQ